MDKETVFSVEASAGTCCSSLHVHKSPQENANHHELVCKSMCVFMFKAVRQLLGLFKDNLLGTLTKVGHSLVVKVTASRSESPP